EFELDAERVPDLDGDAHDDRRAETHQGLKPWFRRKQRKETAGKHVRQPVAASLGRHDKKEHEELAIDTRAAQNAPYPAIQTKIDERCERPDLLRIDDAAEKAGQKAECRVERQRQVCAVIESGEREQYRAQYSPARAEKETEKNDGRERDVGGEKVGDRGPNPDAQGERNQEKGQQGEGLAGAAILGEEQATKAAGAGQHAGHGGNDAQ